MSIEFSTVGKKIIYSREVGTILILLLGNNLIKLLNVALMLEYETNLISFGQLQYTSLIYHNEPI